MQMHLKTAIRKAVAGEKLPWVMHCLVDGVMDDLIEWPKSKVVARRRRRNKIARASRKGRRI
jgi:hypothetical protein